MTVTRINWDTLTEDPNNDGPITDLFRAHNANDSDYAAFTPIGTLGQWDYAYFSGLRTFNLPGGETPTQVQVQLKLEEPIGDPFRPILVNYFGAWWRESTLPVTDDSDPWVLLWGGESTGNIDLPKGGSVDYFIISPTNLDNVQMRIGYGLNSAGLPVPGE